MASVAEYFALKKAANPGERDVKGISTMMALNAQNKDPYGMSGLANLPLSYALGRAEKTAGEYDQKEVEQSDSYMQQIMAGEQQKQAQGIKQDAMKNLIELAKSDVTAANKYLEDNKALEGAFPSGFKFSEKITKDGWMKTDPIFSDDGTTKDIYHFNLRGMAGANKKLAEQGALGVPTAQQLAGAMEPGFAFVEKGGASAAKDVNPPTLTSNIGPDANGKPVFLKNDGQPGPRAYDPSYYHPKTPPKDTGDNSGTLDLDNTISMVWKDASGKNYSQNFDIRKPEDRSMIQTLAPGVSTGFARVVAIGKNAEKKTGLKAAGAVQSSSDAFGGVRTNASGDYSGGQRQPVQQPTGGTPQITREEALAELKRRGVI
jgi:hypothetical protein